MPGHPKWPRQLRWGSGLGQDPAYSHDNFVTSSWAIYFVRTSARPQGPYLALLKRAVQRKSLRAMNSAMSCRERANGGREPEARQALHTVPVTKHYQSVHLLSRLRGANWYAGHIFHSADLRVVTNVHETATWWSVKVRNGAGCVPTPPLPLPAERSWNFRP